MSDTTTLPSTPFPIHRLAHNYYLYSTPLITSLRATHNIPGTLIGTLPQCPQQNVFLGLPLLLSHAETRLLVRRRFGYIVNDVKSHKEGLLRLGKDEREKWIGTLRKEGEDISRRQVLKLEERRDRALEGMDEKKRLNVLSKLENTKAGDGRNMHVPDNVNGNQRTNQKRVDGRDSRDDDSLFSTNDSIQDATKDSPTLLNHGNPVMFFENSQPALTSSRGVSPTVLPMSIKPATPIHFITPTTSSPPLPVSALPRDIIDASDRPSADAATTVIPAESSSPLLHSKSSNDSHSSLIHFVEPPPFHTAKNVLHNFLSSQSYFLLPGLRFGCHFSAYPGDPLRFHSHFLCRGYGWDEDIDLVDLVGGGRLGTGVKKGYLVGGVEAKDGERDEGSADEEAVRCFCIEWGGM